MVTPTRDDEVVETLPAVSSSRADDRRLRQQLIANPGDAALAAQLARRYLDHARKEGDPRYAGRALAALQAWPVADTAPDEIVLLLATLQQFLHDFDTVATNLERLVKRQPRNAQAWLTLATVQRVQGRFEASNRACDGIAAAGPTSTPAPAAPRTTVCAVTPMARAPLSIRCLPPRACPQGRATGC